MKTQYVSNIVCVINSVFMLWSILSLSVFTVNNCRIFFNCYVNHSTLGLFYFSKLGQLK